jgi:hypothetical protein
MLDRTNVAARYDHEPIDGLEALESVEANKLRDPDGARLKALARSIGVENMSAGEKERLQCTYDGDRHQLIKLQKQRAEQQRRGVAQTAQLQFGAEWEAWSNTTEKRVQALEEQAWHNGLDKVVASVLAECLDAVAKKAGGDLKAATEALEAKLSARIEAAVVGLMASSQKTAEDAAAAKLAKEMIRFDEKHTKVLVTTADAERERNDIELGLVRDELLGRIDAKTYNGFTESPGVRECERAVHEINEKLFVKDAELVDLRTTCVNRIDASDKRRRGDRNTVQ